MILSVPYYMGDLVEGAGAPPEAELLDVSLHPGSQQERMSHIYGRLADRVAETEDFPVAWGVDCVIILGVLAGLQRRGVDPVVLFFDAHGDFNTWETTPSGFIGGMPLAMVTGRGEQSILEACRGSVVPDADAVLIDGRDLDPEEQILIEQSEVRQLSVTELREEHLPPGRPLYVHVDTDVVDPAEMPAVNYIAPHGPSLAEVVAAMERLAGTDRVVAFSLAAHNPALPGAEQSQQATLALARPFL